MKRKDILSEVRFELQQQMVIKQENTEISKQAQGEPEHLFLVVVNHNDPISDLVKEWIAPLSVAIPIPHTAGELFQVEEGQRLAVLTSLPPTSEGVTLIKKYKREK